MRRIPRIPKFNGTNVATLNTIHMAVLRARENRDRDVDLMFQFLSLCEDKVAETVSQYIEELDDFDEFYDAVVKHYCPRRSEREVTRRLDKTYPFYNERPKDYLMQLRSVVLSCGRRCDDYAHILRGRIFDALEKSVQLSVPLPDDEEIEDGVGALQELIRQLDLRIRVSGRIDIWAERAEKREFRKKDVAAAVMEVAATGRGSTCEYCGGANHTEDTCIKKLSNNMKELARTVDSLRKSLVPAPPRVHTRPVNAPVCIDTEGSEDRDTEEEDEHDENTHEDEEPLN